MRNSSGIGGEETRKVDGMAFETGGKGGSIANDIDDTHCSTAAFHFEKAASGRRYSVLMFA